MSGFPRSHPVRPIHVPAPLCLLCSSTVPPSTSSASSSASSSSSKAVITDCCGRIICAACVERSPRTARWSPCLACEGSWKADRPGKAGAVDGNANERESDFVLGNDDVNDNQDDTPEDMVDDGVPASPHEEEGGDQASPAALVRHIVQKSDTLIGIALKYGLDPHALCALNSLPQSTIHTTPHLLHTRVYLLLLPSPPPPLPASVQTQLAHERALARFATVTKESDAGVRGAYVALAELERTTPSTDAAAYEGEKEKPSRVQPGGAGDSIEGWAVAKFYADEEFVKTNPPRSMGFPVASGSGWKSAGSAAESSKTGPSSWWSGWGSSPKVDAGVTKAREAGVKVG